MKNARTVCLPAMTFVSIFTIGALLSCDEMGLSEDGGPIVTEEALESSCVCRVDGDVDTSGDGETWETAKETVEECVSALEPEANGATNCEVWVKEGTTNNSVSFDSTKPGPAVLRSNIKAYGGFKGDETTRTDVARRILRQMEASSENHIGNASENATISKGADLPIVDLPEPCLLAADDCVDCLNNNLYTENSGGKIGLGTNAPSRYLHVKQADDDANIFLEADTNNLGSELENAYIEFSQDGAAVAGLVGTFEDHITNHLDNAIFFGTTTDYPVQLIQNDTAVMTISADQKIGIGVTTPVVNLHLDSTSDTGIRVQSGSGYDSLVQFYNDSNGKWKIYNDGTSNKLLIHAYPNGGKDMAWFEDDPTEFVVDGKIRAEEVVVETISAPDYVFDPSYPLMSLEEVENNILANGHLPEVPAADEMESRGLSVGETTTLLLKKIEELTLYAIEQEKRIKRLEEDQGRKGEDRNCPKSH